MYFGAQPAVIAYTLGCLISIATVSEIHGSPRWLITIDNSGNANATSSTRMVRCSLAGFIGPGTPTLIDTTAPSSHAAVYSG